MDRRTVIARAATGEATSSTRGAAFFERREALRFTLLHGRAERGAHSKLIEIKAFAVQAVFEYGSTGIIETL